MAGRQEIYEVALINCPTPESAAMTMASLWKYREMGRGNSGTLE
jgi:hypothetical protein